MKERENAALNRIVGALLVRPADLGCFFVLEREMAFEDRCRAML